MQDVIETVQIGAHHDIPVLFAQRRKGAVAGQAGITHHTIIRAVLLDIGFQRRTTSSDRREEG